MPALRWGGALVCALLALAAAHVRASGFDISPTRVVLAPDHRVQTLRVRNASSVPVAFEVRVKHWRMEASGRWTLEDLAGPTALVVHPLSFQVAPGKTQLLRVGLSRPAEGGAEQAYRLIVRELPSADRPKGPLSVGVVTQMSLPIFASDGQAKAQASLDTGSIQQGRWRYVLRATGTAHLDPAKLSLRLLDAKGVQLATQDVIHGYVLAGASLPVEVKLEPQVCQTAERFQLVAASGIALHQGALPPAPRSCDS